MLANSHWDPKPVFEVVKLGKYRCGNGNYCSSPWVLQVPKSFQKSECKNKRKECRSNSWQTQTEDIFLFSSSRFLWEIAVLQSCVRPATITSQQKVYTRTYQPNCRLLHWVHRSIILHNHTIFWTINQQWCITINGLIIPTILIR